MPIRSRSSVLRATVCALRKAALECREGELIGWEEDLVARFKISRPTLRQAAALVAQEQLITVRRGAGGGYFARRPDEKAVAHMTAIYLQSHAAQMSEVIRAAEPIMVELSRLAARCADPVRRAQLATFLETDQRRDTATITFDVMNETARQFSTILADMGGNKVLGLFLAIIYGFIFLNDKVATTEAGGGRLFRRNVPERIVAYRAGRDRLARAVLAGDEAMAVDCAHRNAMAITAWLTEDLASRQAACAADGAPNDDRFVQESLSRDMFSARTASSVDASPLGRSSGVTCRRHTLPNY